METEKIERNSDSQEKIKEKRESNFRIRTSQRITLRVYTIFHLVRARFTAKSILFPSEILKENVRNARLSRTLGVRGIFALDVNSEPMEN